MKKYDIMGWKMVKLDAICYGIRRTMKEADGIFYENRSDDYKAGMRKACELLTRFVFLDEIQAAKDDDAVNAILEIPGDFIVAKNFGNYGKRAIMYFSEFQDHEPVITDKANRCMHFTYEGMAQHVAETLNEKLGDEWHVTDTCQEAYDDQKRLLNAIFRDDEDDSEEADI